MSGREASDYYDRYSRQIYVLGERTMQSLGKASVLISGLGGLGVEIAKCVALAGPQRLTLHDTSIASWWDLSTQYYLNESSLGENRAVVSAKSISQLNPFVKVETSTTSLLNEDFLASFTCVVLTQAPLKLQKEVDTLCRKLKIPFITAEVRGAFSWVFTDFGENFVVFDKNGESEKEFFVGNISQAKQALVTCLDNELHDLETGDTIKLTEVKGMTSLNWSEEQPKFYTITVVSPKSFLIDADTSSLPPYEGGGLVSEKKTPQVHSFNTLEEALKNPNYLDSDLSKLGISAQFHIGMQALHLFIENHQNLPRPWNSDDAQLVLKYAQQINDTSQSKVELRSDLITKLAFTARGEFIGLTATVGGHVAQEVLKAVSGKFTPQGQWLYLDAMEVIGDGDASDHQPLENSRYDSQIVVFGRNTFRKLQNASIFMIGAGAIGCEMLKNYAMLGVSTDGSGVITVSDNDNIEKSNLNRQFLFRDQDITKPKSTTAGEAAKRINPQLRVDAYLDKIGPTTQGKYDDQFFKRCSVVVNALDNVEARVYVDRRCVATHRPLLESGTMGTKGHVQVILPYKTESYESQADPPETGFAFCTIKSFPAKIQHTIQWARDKFEALFVIRPSDFGKLLQDPQTFVSLLGAGSGASLVTLNYINKRIDNPINSFESCIQFAVKKFQAFFHNQPLQLLHVFPLDSKLKDGSLFWALPKRPPKPILFNAGEPSHLDFVWAVSHLTAKLFQVNVENSKWTREKVANYASSIPLPPFKPKSNKEIVTDEKVTKAPEKNDADAYQTAVTHLKSSLSKLPKVSIQVEQFEKDDDTNFHVDFITAASNLRAANYGIEPANKLETKRIAGRIIPAIATTTACVAGLVSIELVKVVMQDIPEQRDIEKFKNTFLNLALPLFTMSEPAPAKKIPIIGSAFYTLWDSWTVKDPTMTLQDFFKFFKTKYGLDVTGVFKGVHSVYLSVMPQHKARLPKKLVELLPPSQNKEEYVDLTVTFADENDEEVEAPTVRFWFTV